MITTKKLSQIELFNDLSQKQLETIKKLAENRNFAKGETIFKEGDPATFLFIILEGKVRIQVKLSRPENLAIVVLSQFGQLVGWSGLHSSQNYTAAATCLEDCQMITLEGEQLMRALEEDKEMGFLVLRKITVVISSRLRNLQRTVLKTL